MKYQSDIKSGLDPLFGLPVTRDSKAMDAARCKNFRFDKRLESSLKNIDETMHTKIIKCNNLVTTTREFLTAINPDPDKRVVCPPGLSNEQKKTIRILRRGSLPSMSLNEFDQKLLSTRASRETITTLDDTFTERKINKHRLCEFKLKRKVFSHNSKKFPTSRSTPNLERCVMEKAPATNNPLYRCKTVMGDAYQRLTSADVAKNTNRDTIKFAALTDIDKDKTKYRRTDRVFSDRSSSEASVGSYRRHVGFSRNGRVQSTCSSSSDSSSEEERYERFLTVLRGETTKLPDIVMS